MAVDPRFHPAVVAQPLAALVAAASGSSTGDPAARFAAIAPLDQATPADVAYCDGRRHRAALRETRAGAVFVAPPFLADVPESSVAIVCAQPALGFARAARLFHPPVSARPGIHPTAVIGDDVVLATGCAIGPCAVIGSGARLGEGCVVHPHAVVGEGVVLGARCVLHVHSSISHALAGDGVVLHPGARIGQEGFGLVPTAAGFETMPQFGRVLLGDGVEVGANACIDRGAMGDTMIGSGTRIDNLVQVGHGVHTGHGCILVAQVGIAGSTVLGHRVVIAAQAGLVGHLKIGDGVRIGAQAGVMQDVVDGNEVLGSPAWPVRETWRAMARLRQLARRKDDT